MSRIHQIGWFWRYLILLGLVTIMLLVSGCKANLLVELYSSDLRSVDTAKTGLTTPAIMEFQIPSADECDKYAAQIVALMKEVVQHFKPQGCLTRELESFLKAEVQSPIVPNMSSWEESGALVGVVVDKGSVVVTLNRSKFEVLNTRMQGEYLRTLNLADSTVTVIVNNDERETQKYETRGALVNGEPIYHEGKDIEVPRRGKAKIELSNVGSAFLAKNGYAPVVTFKSVKNGPVSDTLSDRELAELTAILEAVAKEKPESVNAPYVIEGAKLSVEAMRTTLPQKIDVATTLIDVDWREPTTFVYKFELDTGTLPVRKEMFQTVQGSVVTTQVCRQPVMQSFLGAGGTYLYHYTDKAGEVLADITISQKDCPK